MALMRLKKLLAAAALAVAVNGGAPAALATTGEGLSSQQRAAVTSGPARTAADRQRLTENAWMSEQLRAERASRRSDKR